MVSESGLEQPPAPRYPQQSQYSTETAVMWGCELAKTFFLAFDIFDRGSRGLLPS